MKYLILSSCGLELFLVPRLCKEKEVEKVYFWHRDTRFKNTGKNMENFSGWEKFELIPDFWQALRESNKEELRIIIGDVGLGETGEGLKKLGYNVIGGSRFGDRVEDDRTYATEFMKKFMKVPESTSFDTFEAGLQFLQTQEKDMRFVFKPNDAEVPKDYTYVSKNVKDMINFIKDAKPLWIWKESFQLQKFIKGIEVDFNAYFDGENFIEDTFLLYFENKPVMDNDVGPATGGSIAVSFRPPKGEGAFWDILQKIASYLKKVGYKGQLAINCIVGDEDKELYFIEFCVRCGYPSLAMEVTFLEDNNKSIHNLFTAMVERKHMGDLIPIGRIVVTIVVYVPPAPNKEGYIMESTKGQPISWDRKWDRYFFPYYIMYDNKKGMVLSGVESQVLQITCVDSTLQGAIEMLYETYVSTLKLKNAMYRSDLGIDAKRRIQKLKEWKLL